MSGEVGTRLNGVLEQPFDHAPLGGAGEERVAGERRTLLLELAVVLFDPLSETTRSSTTETAFRDAVDDVPLVAANVVSSFRELPLDFRLEPVKRPPVTAYELAVDGVVSHGYRKGFDVGDVDERRVRSLEVTCEETPFPEPLPGGEVRGKLDGDVEVGRRARGPLDQ